LAATQGEVRGMLCGRVSPLRQCQYVEGGGKPPRNQIISPRQHSPPLDVDKVVGLMLANQRVELNVAIEKQKQHLAHRFNHHCFKNLIYNVSNFALGKLLG